MKQHSSSKRRRHSKACCLSTAAKNRAQGSIGGGRQYQDQAGSRWTRLPAETRLGRACCCWLASTVRVAGCIAGRCEMTRSSSITSPNLGRSDRQDSLSAKSKQEQTNNTDSKLEDSTAALHVYAAVAAAAEGCPQCTTLPACHTHSSTAASPFTLCRRRSRRARPRSHPCHSSRSRIHCRLPHYLQLVPLDMQCSGNFTQRAARPVRPETGPSKAVHRLLSVLCVQWHSCPPDTVVPSLVN